MAEMKNYAAMAQGAAPQEQSLPQEELGPIDFPEELQLTDEDFSEMNMPTGDSPEAFKERIIQMLERFGLLDELNATDKMQLMQDVERLVQDALSGNLQGMAQNPVNEMLMGAEQKLESVLGGETFEESEDAA